MSLIKRLSEIQNLPTLPEVFVRVQQLIMSEEGDATLLARIIEQDPSLSTRVLRVANSSFYCATSGKITSISFAITRIGFNEVGHLALAADLVRKFSRESNVLDYSQFWKHSLTAAYMGYLIAEKNRNGLFPFHDRHTLFLAGLLHDIGILVYDQFFHEEFEHIIKTAVGNETSFLMAEKDTVPKEMHGIIGGELLSHWKIDQTVASAVRFHHAPDKAPESMRHQSYATFLSEYYLCNMVLGSFEGSMTFSQSVMLDALGMTNDDMLDCLQRAQVLVDRSDLALALDKEHSVTRLKTI